jgi:DNA polymerase-1
MPILQADAKALEWRALVELSRDEVALAELFEGQDIHALNKVAFDLPERLIAKIYLFRTIFRGTGYSFAHDNAFNHVSDSPKYWDAVNEKFFAKYSGVDKKHHEWCEQVMRGEPIVGPLGREWLIELKHIPGKDFKIPWTLLTNYPVQGTGADIMVIARVSAAKRLAATSLTYKWISTVHDSLALDVPTKDLQAVANILYQVFDDIPANIKKIFNYDWIVPMPCECKYGPNMKHTTDLLRTI